MRESEPVHAILDWWDGPTAGIADFDGAPHYFESVGDPAADALDRVYMLWPLDEPTLQLAMEDWDIWLRWERAFHAGETGIETHPALAEDRARHDEIAGLLTLPPPSDAELRAKGSFDGPRVTWSRSDDATGMRGR